MQKNHIEALDRSVEVEGGAEEEGGAVNLLYFLMEVVN